MDTSDEIVNRAPPPFLMSPASRADGENVVVALTTVAVAIARRNTTTAFMTDDFLSAYADKNAIDRGENLLTSFPYRQS